MRVAVAVVLALAIAAPCDLVSREAHPAEAQREMRLQRAIRRFDALTTAYDPVPTCGFEKCRGAKSRHDLCSLENDQKKTHYRQRGSSHRRCHAWIR
jgi:hypothetical protein